MDDDTGHNRLAVLAEEITRADGVFRRSASAALAAAIEAGRALVEVKGLLPHGAWQPWLRDNCAMSSRSARRYMQLADADLKTDTATALSIRGALAEITRQTTDRKLYQECREALQDYTGAGFDRVVDGIADPAEALWFLRAAQAAQNPAMLAFLFVAQEMRNEGAIERNPVMRLFLLPGIAAA
jgi:hypothetical protein